METESPKIVVFSLGTTGPDEDDVVTQIAAYAKCSDSEYYFNPTGPFRTETGNGDCKTLQYAFETFEEFIVQLKSHGKKIILVSHDCFKFGMPKLMKLAEDIGYLESLKSVLYGFGDTLTMFKDILADRNKTEGSFSIPNLVKDYIGYVDFQNYVAKEAEMLLKLLDIIGVSDEYVVQNAKRIEHRSKPSCSETKLSPLAEPFVPKQKTAQPPMPSEAMPPPIAAPVGYREITHFALDGYGIPIPFPSPPGYGVPMPFSVPGYCNVHGPYELPTNGGVFPPFDVNAPNGVPGPSPVKFSRAAAPHGV